MPAWVLTMGGILLTLIQILGLVHAAHAVVNTRTSQGIIAWVIALITLPVIAIPAYWLFGRNRFVGYLEWEKDPEYHLTQYRDELAATLSQHHTSLPDEAQAFFEANEKLNNHKTTGGNHIELLINGEAYFKELCEQIQSAESSIFLQYFIWNNDVTGNKILDLLITRAAEGVEVCVLADRIGSSTIDPEFFQKLEDAGGRARFFSASGRRGTRLQINFRNHCKIAVFDSRTVLTGGINIGDEYLGKSQKFGPWRDTSVKLQGPCVLDAQLTFLEAWDWSARKLPQIKRIPHFEQEDDAVLIHPSGPTDDLDSCHLFFINAAATAKERLWITTPYFVPDIAVASALAAASLRGVDVRILLPLKSDHFLVYLAAHSYQETMHHSGVSLYRYTEGFMHQKILLIDNHTASVGSANLDNRSFRLNFELNVISSSSRFVSEVSEMLKNDFERATRVPKDDFAKRPIAFKVCVYIARIFAPIL